ncbi:MAG: glycosyltransferase family 2 protein [Bacteroidetes bacterium]|nr:MAG: glycosyltransferase family 2 protein [Bacteroidota bacterium]
MTRYLQEKVSKAPIFRNKPSPLLGLVVVIPCCNEPHLLLSLMALQRCQSPDCDVEVIVGVNDAENAPEAVKRQNRATCEQALKWAQQNNNSRLRFLIHYEADMPKKHAGVGLARKTGMDEACFRFAKAGVEDGVIVCFDADSRCDENFLREIHRHFTAHPECPACSIYFEHPLSGADFEPEVYEAIARYELHLRYYVAAQRWAGLPHAFQTIGSSMAVRSNAYQQQGGMNRRKAGEDFYFLHKFIPLEGFAELNSTRVIPSPRPSDRVPFGTGKAVGKILKNKGRLLTYHPEGFIQLRDFLRQDLYNCPPEELNLSPLLRQFFASQNFSEKWAEIKSHTATERTFRQRFFRWFDAFMVMKYVHFVRDKGYPDVPVEEAAAWLMNEMTTMQHGASAVELLNWYREKDRGGWALQ